MIWTSIHRFWFTRSSASWYTEQLRNPKTSRSSHLSQLTISRIVRDRSGSLSHELKERSKIAIEGHNEGNQNIGGGVEMSTRASRLRERGKVRSVRNGRSMETRARVWSSNESMKGSSVSQSWGSSTGIWRSGCFKVTASLRRLASGPTTMSSPFRCPESPRRACSFGLESGA